MKLTELKKQIDRSIEFAQEIGENPDEIVVSLQIDGPDEESVWGSDELEVVYDNNGQASGCVLHCLRSD